VSVTREDIERGFRELGIGAGVVVHSSLSSFGWVEGGAEAAVDALISSFPLVMVPTFTWGKVGAPMERDIPRNGPTDHLPEKLEVFRPGSPVIKDIGITPETFRRRPEAKRSAHPSHSFAAVGEGAEEVLSTQGYEDPLAPIEALAARGGWVLMVGTELTSCTAIHAAETRAGRRLFIRSAVDENGRRFRVRVPSCSRAFGNFDSVLDPVKREVTIGGSRVRAYPGEELLSRAADAIRRDPRITVCDPECPRCRDTLAGGPPE